MKRTSRKEKPSTQEQSTIESETISGTDESEVGKSSSNVRIVDVKDYHVAERTIHFFQNNHVINKPKTKSSEAEEHVKKAKSSFMIDLKTRIHKTSIDPIFLQLKIWVRNKQKDRAPEKFSPVFCEIIEQFGLLFTEDIVVIPEELKRAVVDALQFRHPGSTKMLAESSGFWWSGMKEDIKNKCITCPACMSSGKNSKYQLLYKKIIKLQELTEPGQGIQNDFLGKL